MPKFSSLRARPDHEPAFGPGLVRHYLRDLIYGAHDGIITTFAVVAGVTGAALAPRTILILGFANLLADGVSMGASNYLSIRSDEAARAAEGAEGMEPFPFRHGTATFLAFILAGSLPLLPYLALDSRRGFPLAVVATGIALFLVGSLRASVTQLRWLRAGLEVVAVGAVAALLAYGTGWFLGGLV